MLYTRLILWCYGKWYFIWWVWSFKEIKLAFLCHSLMHFFLLGQIEITFVFYFEVKPYRDTLEVRLNNLNRTYLCRLSTLVLKAQPYLFLFIPIRGLFYPSVLLLELCSALKTFLEPSNVPKNQWKWLNVDYLLWFSKCSHIPLLLIETHLEFF